MADREVILAALRAVNLVADERALVPVMACAAISDGRIEATNGVMTVSAPLHLAKSPRAVISAARLLDVVARGDGSLYIAVAESIATAKSGSATARLRLFPPESFPRATGDASKIEKIELSSGVFKIASLCDGSTRPWAGGVLLRGGHAVTTNGISIMTSTVFPDLGRDAVVPRSFFDTILSIGREVTGFGLGDNSITAHLSDGWWVRSALIAAMWPDVTSLFAFDLSSLPETTLEFRNAIASVAAVAGDRHVELTALGPRMIADDDFAIAIASGVEGRFSGATLAFAAKYANYLGRIDARRFGFSGSNVTGTLTEVIAP